MKRYMRIFGHTMIVSACVIQLWADWHPPKDPVRSGIQVVFIMLCGLYLLSESRH